MTDDTATRFERCFTDNYPAIAAYLLRRCASREDAEDAATEVFAVAWRRIGEATAATGAPGVDDVDLELINDVRYEGSDIDITGTTHYRGPGAQQPDSSYGFRAVDGNGYWRYGDGAFELDKNPPGDTAGGLQTRVQAAEALAAAARAAADVQQTTVDGGTQYTATVAAADVPDQFRPPLKRTAETVTITAVAGDNGALRSLALRAPGEAVDVTFSELGEPQRIVVP